VLKGCGGDSIAGLSNAVFAARVGHRYLVDSEIRTTYY
jgi:hypothetical protein